MTITLDTRQLRAAAGEAESVALTGAEGAAPIFANVLIAEEADGLVRFSATDLDTAIDRCAQLVQGDLAREPLRTTVSAKYLKAIAEKLPRDGQAKLELAEISGLRITCGRFRFKLATLPAADFPDFPAEPWDAEFDMPVAALAGLIDGLSFAMSSEATRYYLNGIYFHRADSAAGPVLRAAATDGSRLARAQVALPDGAEDFPQAGVIVPRKALKVIGDLLGHLPVAEEDEDPTSVSVAVSSRRIEIAFSAASGIGMRFSSKLIDGTFPDYARVIPAANDKLLTIDRAALIEAVEVVAAISAEKTRIVKLALAPDMVTLSVTSAESGSAGGEVPAEFSGAAMETGFNSKYLLDVLARIEGATVVAEIADPAAPSLWRSADDRDSLFVLMPVRV